MPGEFRDQAYRRQLRFGLQFIDYSSVMWLCLSTNEARKDSLTVNPGEKGDSWFMIIESLLGTRKDSL